MNEPADKPTVALIIDDEVQIRRLLRLTLEAHGYRVFEAENGPAGRKWSCWTWACRTSTG